MISIGSVYDFETEMIIYAHNIELENSGLRAIVIIDDTYEPECGKFSKFFLNYEKVTV